MPLTRTDFQSLAEARVREAGVLLAAGEWSGAYYVAGYAVECALKACVAKKTVAEEFPDKKRVAEAHTHNIETLVRLAGLLDDRTRRATADPAFQANYNLVKEWAEDARYEWWDEAQARTLVAAITDPTHGVLPWIRTSW